MNTPALNGNEPSNKQTSENSVHRVPGKKLEVNNFIRI